MPARSGYEASEYKALNGLFDQMRRAPRKPICAEIADLTRLSREGDLNKQMFGRNSLERVPRTPAGQREEQFARLRDRIDACVSRKFLAREFEGTPPGIIVRSIDFRS
jgi:hypothetical protein